MGKKQRCDECKYYTEMRTCGYPPGEYPESIIVMPRNPRGTMKPSDGNSCRVFAEVKDAEV